jgi:histidine ammonia-lyase
MLMAFNKSCLSYVPEKGTVGASGDLAPLSHLALGLIGQGKMWNPTAGQYEPASQVLAVHGLTPIQLGPKEGLAMINGTQFIASLGSEAVVRAEHLTKVADVVGALTLEVLKGTPVAFDPKIHADRPHSGQIASAERLRRLLGSNEPSSRSSLAQSHYNVHQVQDSYTLRCMPQVHGISSDTVAFVKQILTTELNSATDNPMIFTETGESLSGGNFHGEYPAKAMDYLAIGIHELASISERRIERLLNPQLSGLPAFLVRQGGLNSGFMIAHCTAAALVSENKVLTHPSSVDSIPTSASKEDHVSMGGYAARKALQVVDHVEKVLAIELMCACQALDILRPLQTTPVLEKVYAAVRQDLNVATWERDRFVAPDMERIAQWIREGRLWHLVETQW